MIDWPLAVLPEARIWPDAPGRFGAVRSTDIHTGVDLYCELGTQVLALEGGVVRAVEPFTGAHVPAPDTSPWWNDTFIVLVEGPCGVIGYGELAPLVQVGDVVVAGDVVGEIRTSVLRKYKGRPQVMLHLEHYSAMPENYDPAVGSATVWWPLDTPRPDRLLDPEWLLGLGPTFDLSTYTGLQYRNPEAL